MPTNDNAHRNGETHSGQENEYSQRVVDILLAQPLNPLTRLSVSVGPVSVIELTEPASS